MVASRGAILSLVLLAGGCIEPDLGNVPFYCNNGEPRCPEGYECVANMCVKGGVIPADAPITADMGDGPLGPDWLMPWPEGSVPDMPVFTDAPPMKWDIGKLPDAPKPTTDGWPPHLGCQSHSECDSSNPCCCPFLLQIWTCLPLCLNPFCI